MKSLEKLLEAIRMWKLELEGPRDCPKVKALREEQLKDAYEEFRKA